MSLIFVKLVKNIIVNFEQYMLPCFSKKLFGIECFGCGTQRAFFLIIDGQFKNAFFMFPPIYTTIVFFVLVFLNFTDKSRNYHKLLISFAIINAVLMVCNYFFKLFYR
jgi:hypothetical protein